MQHDFILLDRSGSMQSRWVEALSSVNAYVHKLAEDHIDTGVTLATFDKHAGEMVFEVIRERIIPRTWRDVSAKECGPRGDTPLNDAVVRIANLALAGAYDKTALIVMTDGEENASKEDRTGAVAKTLLDQCRAKGWQVIFLGVDFDNWHQARGYGNLQGSTASVVQGQMVNSMRMTGGKRAEYSATGATMDFSDDEKAELANKKP